MTATLLPPAPTLDDVDIDEVAADGTDSRVAGRPAAQVAHAALPWTARLAHRVAGWLTPTAARPGTAQARDDHHDHVALDDGHHDDGDHRRGFLLKAAVFGTAVVTNPITFALKPVSAYATVCGDGTGCGSGWTVFCCTVNAGRNTCPPGSYAAGWWKADASSFCGGRARYYIDCNRLPSQPNACSCTSCFSNGSCDVRRYCCNAFRYGQCNLQIAGVTPVVCRVISCTPPWQWSAACTATSRTDNRTESHSAPCLPGRNATPIELKYQDLGLVGSFLGAATSAQYDGGGGTTRADYQNGSIFHRADTGARALATLIRDNYVTRGGPAGFFGPPTGDSLPYGAGFTNEFLAGITLAGTPTGGVYALYGSLRTRWFQLGGPGGPLGFPIFDVEPAESGGGSQARFANGTITAKDGIPTAATYGPHHVLWRSLGATAGALGYPLTEPATLGDGLGQVEWFEGGATLWTAATGAITVRNPLLTKLFASGGPTNRIGYPTAEQETFAGGAGLWQRFERGAVTSHPDAGARIVVGGFGSRYLQLGGPDGGLGAPLTDEAPVGDRIGTVQWFANGALFWSPTTGIREVLAPILHAWYAVKGGPLGSYGYPTAAPDSPTPNVLRSRFQRGTITFDNTTGAFTFDPA